MIRAKNYDNVTKFVKVMRRILWPLFSRTRCILQKATHLTIHVRKGAILGEN